MTLYFWVKLSSMPSKENSRPIPLCLTPLQDSPSTWPAPLVDLHPAGVDPVGGPKRLTDVARPRGFVGARGLKRAAAHSLVANLSTRTDQSLVSVISRI